MIVRCIDASFQTDVSVKGREYEVRAEGDDCYILSGFDKGFSKTRFEIVPLVGRLREIAKHAEVDGKTVARLRDDDEMAPRDHCSLRPSADVAARGFRAGKRASRGAYSRDDQRNADDSDIRMPQM